MNNKKVLDVAVIVILLLSMLTAFSGVTSGQSGSITPTDSDGVPREYYRKGDHQIYFELSLNGVANEIVTVTLENMEGTVEDIKKVEVDDNGEYFSHEDGTFFETDKESLKPETTYFLNVSDPSGDYEKGEVHVYEEAHYDQNSEIMPCDENGLEKELFSDEEKVCFKGEMRDQHDNPPSEEKHVRVKAEKNGETKTIWNGRTDENGDTGIEILNVFKEMGEYGMIFQERDGTGETIYDEANFTVLGVDIEITPAEEVYTQGQEIEIEVESNYDQKADISIQDFENDAAGSIVKEWSSENINEGWSKNYTVPSDLPDGNYRIIVQDSGTEEILEQEILRLKKYRLRVETDKSAYIPGEEVDVYYAISEIIDGSPAEDFDVNFEMVYKNKTGEEKNITGEVTDGHFSFEIPMDIDLPSRLSLNIQGKKNEDHEVYWSGTRDVNELEVMFETDREEYYPGDVVYATVETYVRPIMGLGFSSPVEEGKITASLEDAEGNKINGTERIALTDDSGKVVVPVKLTEDLEKGTYTLKVTAEKNDFSDEFKMEIEVIDREKELKIRLEREKNSYSPGEEVEVDYAVTRGEEAVDAAVEFVIKRNEPYKIYDIGQTENGTIRFEVPDNFNQNDHLILKVSTEIEQEEADAEMKIPVTGIQLLLNADKSEYQSGETVHFEYEVLGTQKIGSVGYKIINARDETVERGYPENGGFEFQVPDHPSQNYQVKLTVISRNGIMVNENLQLNKERGYRLEAGIATDSDYTTEVYRPGEKIKIHYKLTPRGDENLPDKITLQYSFLEWGYWKTIQTDQTEGHFTIEVPEVSDGTYHLQINSEGSFNIEPIKVKENPSVMNRETVGGLSLLSLTGLALILLIIAGMGYLFLSRTERESKESAAEKSEEKTEEIEKVTTGEEVSKEKRKSAKEKAHGWEGPEEKEEGRIDRLETESEDQIEPDEPDW